MSEQVVDCLIHRVHGWVGAWVRVPMVGTVVWARCAWSTCLLLPALCLLWPGHSSRGAAHHTTMHTRMMPTRMSNVKGVCALQRAATTTHCRLAKLPAWWQR